MTYDRTADIYIPYGRYKKREQVLDEIPTTILENTSNRSRTAVAMISHCEPRRLEKVRQLSAHIQLDVIGKCGNFSHKECDAFHPRCHSIIAHQYYFYLALENHDCPDYVTEKAWHTALVNGMVPIVWSSVIDYAAILPPKSFINVADFGSLEVFAKEISELIAYPHLYMRYHEWRRTYDLERHGLGWWGSMCQWAIENKGKPKPAIDIATLRYCGD